MVVRAPWRQWPGEGEPADPVCVVTRNEEMSKDSSWEVPGAGAAAPGHKHTCVIWARLLCLPAFLDLSYFPLRMRHSPLIPSVPLGQSDATFNGGTRPPEVSWFNVSARDHYPYARGMKTGARDRTGQVAGNLHISHGPCRLHSPCPCPCPNSVGSSTTTSTPLGWQKRGTEQANHAPVPPSPGI